MRTDHQEDASWRHDAVRQGLGRLSRLAARTSRTGIVLFSAAVVASMVGSVLIGPLGERVLAQDGYGKRDRDASMLSAVAFEADAPRAEAPRHRSWTADAAPRLGRSYTYTSYRRHEPNVRWRALRAATRIAADDRPAVEDALPRSGGHHAVCVRLCDGYFFPMGDIARRDDVDSRDSLCAGLCPGAPTRLFVTPGDSTDMNRATAISTGETYAGLPVAFAHTREVGRTCACHPVDEDQATIISPLTDFTMRSGDSIMTPAGWRVFQGANHWPYRRTDFDSIQAARNLPAHVRTALSRMEDASVGRRVAGGLRPLVVTPRVHVAASLTAEASPMRRVGQDVLGAP